MADNGELMRQIKELDLQLSDANRTIESKMRSLDEQGLVALESAKQLKGIKRELQTTLDELERLKKVEKNLSKVEREAIQNVGSSS